MSLQMNIGNVTLLRQDLQTLCQNHWLNDQVIHAYLGLLQSEHNLTHVHGCYTLPCFLAMKWENGEHSAWLYPQELYGSQKGQKCVANWWRRFIKARGWQFMWDLCPDVRIRIEDIIGCEVISTSWFFNRSVLNLWHIEQKEGNLLAKAHLQITGDEDVWRQLEKEIVDKLKKLEKRPKSLLVLINPIGGNKTAVKDYRNVVSPVFSLAGIKCDVIVSERKKHMIDIAAKYDTSGIDGIVVLGGDGSFTEVASVLVRKAQEMSGVDYNDPKAKLKPLTLPITMIPTGSVNFLAAKTNGCKDVLTAALHVIRGHISQMNVMGVYADGKLVDYGGASVCHGLLVESAYMMDVKYRWLGRLRYFVLPIKFLLFKMVLKMYNAEVTCYTSETDMRETLQGADEVNEVSVNGRKIQNTQLKTKTKDSVTFRGRFPCIFPLNANVINTEEEKVDWKTLHRHPKNVLTTMFYNEKLSPPGLLRQTKDVMNQLESPVDDFYDLVQVRGIKVTLTDEDKGDGSEEELLKHLIFVDAEIYEIKDLEFQVWLHENIVPVYTGFKG